MHIFSSASMESRFIAASILLIFSIVASKAAGRFGVPSLLVFLGVGMAAGSDGPGGIYFNDPQLAQTLGVIALIFILFAGGLETIGSLAKPVAWNGLALSTIGVLVSTGLVGWFASTFLDFSFLEGLLLGATVSSTDAAAVFTVLRGRNFSLKGYIKPLLELESGSNDPMSVFLTVSLLKLITQTEVSAWSLVPMFFQEMFLGMIMGIVAGKLSIQGINRLKLEFEGLYPVLTISVVFLIYGVTEKIGGNGFLAVYLAGMTLGNGNFLRKKSVLLFHDGLAWLMQIVMFLALGLLVFPRQLGSVAASGVLLSLFLVFVARPVSVHLALLGAKHFNFREKMVISWVGLRGAVPIVLATYPLIAHVEKAQMVFNLVFFIVLTSVLLQGTTIPLIAHWFRVEKMKVEEAVDCPIENQLTRIQVPLRSKVAGRTLVDLELPEGTMIVLIHKNGLVLVPRGSTEIEELDTLLVLADPLMVPKVKEILSA